MRFLIRGSVIGIIVRWGTLSMGESIGRTIARATVEKSSLRESWDVVIAPALSPKIVTYNKLWWGDNKGDYDPDIPCEDRHQIMRCSFAPTEERPIGRAGRGWAHLSSQLPDLEGIQEVQDGSWETQKRLAFPTVKFVIKSGEHNEVWWVSYTRHRLSDQRSSIIEWRTTVCEESLVYTSTEAFTHALKNPPP